MIYLSNEPYPQEISVPRSFGVIVPHRNEYLSTADIAADLTTDSDTKVLAASQGVVLKEMVDAKADKSNTYTKAQVNSALALKADKADTYTKAQVDGALAGKQDELVAGENITIEGNVISATGGGSGDSYTRAETDALLAEKADADDVYTKSEVDTALAGKANANAVYTKTEVDEALAEKADVSDIPTKTSDLQNDSGFVTGQEVSQTYETKSDATAKETALQTAINAKQDILTFDNVPTNGSSNPVKSDGIYDALAGKQATIQDLSVIRSGAAAGATAVQPAELSAGLATKQDTINDLATIRSGAAAGATAVQPSQMQAALAGKQDVLTFDTTPTQGSTNPVSSGGVYQALQGAGTVQDVTVGGTSVVANKVAVIPEIPEAVAAQELSIDSTPTANSQNLVTSGGVYDALPKGYRLIASGTIPEDTIRFEVSADTDGNSFRLNEVIIFAQVRGNSAGYTGWVKATIYCETGNQVTGSFMSQFAADTTADKYKSVIGRYRRVLDRVIPDFAFAAQNDTAVKNSLAYITNLYLVEIWNRVGGAITRINLGGYANGGIGAGTYYEIYGVDA